MNLKLILNRAPLFTEDEMKDLDGKVVCQGCRRPNVTGVIQCTCGKMTSDVPETLQELQNLELKHTVRHNTHGDSEKQVKRYPMATHMGELDNQSEEPESLISGWQCETLWSRHAYETGTGYTMATDHSNA